MICNSHDNHVVALLKFEFVVFLGHVASVNHLISLVDFTCYLYYIMMMNSPEFARAIATIAGAFQDGGQQSNSLTVESSQRQMPRSHQPPTGESSR